MTPESVTGGCLVKVNAQAALYENLHPLPTHLPEWQGLYRHLTRNAGADPFNFVAGGARPGASIAAIPRNAGDWCPFGTTVECRKNQLNFIA